MGRRRGRGPGYGSVTLVAGANSAALLAVRLLWIAGLSLMMLSCTRVEAARQVVEVEMANVDLHLSGDLTLHVRHLRGRFEPAGTRQVPLLDDKTSYALTVSSGVLSIDMTSLNALLAQTLGDDRSNVDRLTVSVDGSGDLRPKGVIDKAVPIPFTARAGIEATPDGKLRIYTKSVKGFGLPMKSLMKVFHIEMDDLLKVKPGHGVTVKDNDLILDPATLLPAPSIRGAVTGAKLEGNAVVQTFGDGAVHHLTPRAASANFIYWRGGTLSFGKLTMNATDLELVDMDPKDPFDFSVEHWNDQLIAGYSKTMAGGGLKAHVPDYNDLKTPRPVAPQR